jgi:hypothetical protein
MGIGSISFFQQDQTFAQGQAAFSSTQSATDSLINAIGSAETSKAKGLAAIANGAALKRTNTELTAAIQQVLQQIEGTSGSSTTSTGSSASSSPSSTSSTNAPAKPKPATGTGTALLTTGTSLSSLGILAGGKITVSSGAGLTTFVSSGTDTVGDLINALNVDTVGNAPVTASLNSKGQLVITSRNTTNAIVVGGTGTDAAAIGFGVGHTTFSPPKPPPAPASASPAATATSTSSKNSSSKAPALTNSSPALQSFSTAASLLSASGVGGSLVDLLA